MLYRWTAPPQVFFEDIYRSICRAMVEEGAAVDTGHWQSLENVPHTKTVELSPFLLEVYEMPQTVDSMQRYYLPNLPWAEDHFLERVGGEPLNPGEQYKNWPWYRGGVEDHKATGQFSHTYMERMWPRSANHGVNTGLRYRLGDLNDLVALLARQPYTRQAFLPIWFPEDLAAAAEHEERVPCTLGYHFMLRDGKLNVFYPMRSLDLLRYLRDDLYLANRLALWVRDTVRTESLWHGSSQASAWDPNGPVKLGQLTFYSSSLHVFEGDLPKLRRETRVRL